MSVSYAFVNQGIEVLSVLQDLTRKIRFSNISDDFFLFLSKNSSFSTLSTSRLLLSLWEGAPSSIQITFCSHSLYRICEVVQFAVLQSSKSCLCISLEIISHFTFEWNVFKNFTRSSWFFALLNTRGGSRSRRGCGRGRREFERWRWRWGWRGRRRRRRGRNGLFVTFDMSLGHCWRHRQLPITSITPHSLQDVIHVGTRQHLISELALMNLEKRERERERPCKW